MKKLFLLLCFLFSSLSYAGGGMTHMFLAQELISQVPDAELQDLLNNNLEAYLVGAYYPDSGYVEDNSYGEDSHWDPFLYAFADHIKEKYPNPSVNHPKIVAFLLGCVVHSVSDIVMHHQFYNISKDKDFHGNYSEAHQYGDFGIDILVNIDKDQWLTHPLTWWVPVDDLLQVYHRMGSPMFTRDQIIRGNIAIYFAGYGERLIAAPTYPYLQSKMPWTSANYYTFPQYGLAANEQATLKHVMELWSYIQHNAASKPAHFVYEKKTRVESASPMEMLADKAAKDGIVSVKVETTADGDIEIKQPKIVDAQKFRAMTDNLMQKIH